MSRWDIASDSAYPVLSDIWRALGFPAEALYRLEIGGSDRLVSCFPVSDLAASSIGAACLAVSELIGLDGTKSRVAVDRRLSSLWFGWSIQPTGWEMPNAWDPIAGDYPTHDGWIRLHTNAPHHRAAAISVLRCAETREAVTETVRQWRANELEAAIVAKNGCAAEMRTTDQWSSHPQGRALAAEPLIVQTSAAGEKSEKWLPSASRPLSGIRVLDLTRVLAGPVATRFLAGYGADVLRVDPLDWDEPGLIPEVTLGKRCLRLDLQSRPDRETFERLMRRADVLVHGYRKGALDGLGYGETERRSIRPGLIDVSLNAYGHSGSWEMRRGFDSLVQMSAGIADAGMAWKQSGKPHPLPVQALDQATGYLMAATVVRGLVARIVDRSATTARLSLARTAKLLSDHKGPASEITMPPLSHADLAADIEHTSWGPARRLRPPATLDHTSMKWDRPATALGSGMPCWLG
jgi:hypothetical protein